MEMDETESRTASADIGQLSSQTDSKAVGSTVDKPIDRCRIIWAEAIAAKKKSLTDSGIDEILQISNISNIQSGIESLQSFSRNSRVTRTLLSLQDTIERLKSLVGAISTFIRSDPTYSSLVWGGLLVCLECFSKSNTALKKISNHFVSMAKAMPRFEKYMKLYPGNADLDLALLKIYECYVDTCILSVKFLRQKPWWRPVISVLGPVIQSFDSACASIKENTLEFEREATLAQAIEIDNHHKQVALHHRRVEEVLPLLTIRGKTRDSLFFVPFPRDAGFIGQTCELDTLFANLTHGPPSQKSCTIQGIGGVGKSHLALEFCYEHQKTFPFVFWVAAQNDVSLSISYTKIAALLSLHDEEQGPSPLVIGKARQWLCENPGWLLVFDNVDDDSSILNKFWPPCSHGSIILISQRVDLAVRTNSFIPLKPFGEEYAAKLLLQNYSQNPSGVDRDLVREISREVDGLPLLLVGIGGFLSQSLSSLQETLDTLREAQASSKVFLDEAAFQYRQPIQLVFKLSFDRLPEPAKRVISIMSMLSPSEIPETLIRAKPGPKTEYSDSKIWFAVNIRQQLRLRHLADVRQIDGSSGFVFSMHRSVQRSVLDILDDQMLQYAFNEGVKILRSKLPNPSTIMVPHLTGFDLFEKYMPHIISIHEAFLKYKSRLVPAAPFAEMICSAAAYLYELGLAKQCLQVATTGEAICQELSTLSSDGNSGPSAMTVAEDDIIVFETAYSPITQSFTSLAGNISAYGAGVIWTTGGIMNRQQGRIMTWRVLQLREQHTKSSSDNGHHLDYQHLLSNAYNDWALQLINEGKYHEAKAYSEKSLEMKMMLLNGTSNQFQFFISKILLANILASIGPLQHGDAINMAEEAITHIAREKGPNNPFTLNYKFYVAQVFSIAGKHRKAIELLESSLKARIILFGEVNYNTLNCHYAAALCLHRLEEYAEARVYIDHCMERAEAARWGQEHVLRAKYLQALIMQCIEENNPDWKLREEAAIGERNDLLASYGRGNWTQPTPDVEDMVYFDHLINFHAGRTSAIEL